MAIILLANQNLKPLLFRSKHSLKKDDHAATYALVDVLFNKVRTEAGFNRVCELYNDDEEILRAEKRMCY